MPGLGEATKMEKERGYISITQLCIGGCQKHKKITGEWFKDSLSNRAVLLYLILFTG